jgi:alpha-tubulin suppressor-like RCC1 family protein
VVSIGHSIKIILTIYFLIDIIVLLLQYSRINIIRRVRGMQIILDPARHRYLLRLGVFLIVATLIVGIVGCGDGEGGGGDYYCLTISSTSGGNITEPGKGTFTCYANEWVALAAVPDEHYHFVEWTGDVDTIADIYDASTNIAMNDYYSITANFELDEGWCSLTTSSTEGGLVTQPGEGILVYAANTTVDINAETDEHCHFVNWTGDVDTIADVYDPSTNITMIDSYSVTANFELDEGWYRLTISTTLGGSVVEPGKLISAHPTNTTVALSAQPDEGYEFVKWTGDVDNIADIYDAETDITMYDSLHITANFSANFMVAAGRCYTVGLRSDGRVLAVGENDNGRCDVGSWKSIIQVAAGTFHTVGLKSDGTVVAVGKNDNGECNVGSWTDIIQVACGERHTVGLKSDGTVVAVGSNLHGRCNVDSWTDIIQVAADYCDTVGLKADGTVVAVGYNSWGQGNVGSWTDITQVDVGVAHTVGLKSDGTVVAVGRNNYGQCNVGCWTDIVQVAAGYSLTVGLKSDGTVVSEGSYGLCNVSGWTDIIQVDAGSWYTVGLKPDGTVVAVGKNDDGRCDVSSWTLIMYEGWYSLIISCAAGGSVTEPGEGIFMYAANTTVDLVAQPDEDYQFKKWIGDVDTIDNINAATTNITMYDSYFVTATFGWFDIVEVSAGWYFTVGLKSDHTVVAVGDNYNGQCNVGGWADIIQISAGDYHTVGLKSDGTVVAVGAEVPEEFYHGQCDVDGWTNIIQVAAGGEHTVGLKSDHTVVAVGWNVSGQCDVGSWTDIIQVTAGMFHTVGLKSDGTVVAVGYNDYGQCDVGSWTGITQVAAGGGHTVGLKSDHTAVAVGDNSYGQCYVGTWTDIAQVAAHVHTVGLKSNHTAVAVGVGGDPEEGINTDHGQCDVGTWIDIIQVAAGRYHTVGLKSDGTVVAVGDKGVGQCDVGG